MNSSTRASRGNWSGGVYNPKPKPNPNPNPKPKPKPNPKPKPKPNPNPKPHPNPNPHPNWSGGVYNTTAGMRSSAHLGKEIEKI
eukprot:scaffold64032_cov48-Phaeocystis_antarctica.AAC.1